MTVASEITRLQTAKSDIRDAIEAKGVTVPSSAKLDVYDDYVAQISQGSWEAGAIFAPSSYTCGSIYSKEYLSNGTYIWDGFNRDQTEYCNISRIIEGGTASTDHWYVRVFSKTAGTNPSWSGTNFNIDDYSGGQYRHLQIYDKRVWYDANGNIKYAVLFEQGYGSGESYHQNWTIKGDVEASLGTLTPEQATAQLDSLTGVTASQSLTPLGLTGGPIKTDAQGTNMYTYTYTLDWSNV